MTTPYATPQRDAIRAAFADADRPLAPAEVQKFAQRRIPRLGMATVYRTVKALLDEGYLARVPIPGEGDRYEVAGKQHHHHFHCRRCDAVYEVEGCPVRAHAHLPRGFRVEKHELVLYGLCAQCS